MNGRVREAAAALRDLGDILRRARSPSEALKAFVPASLARRHVLNEPRASGRTMTPPSGAEIAASLRRLTRRLEGEVLADDGHGVRYADLGGSETYRELEATAALLVDLRPEAVGTREETLAFWINLYNVLVVHGIVALGIRESVMEVPSFFATVAYRVGPHTFTPDDIENGVLRRNGRHPATGFRLFPEDDPRMACRVDDVDARVHMALVCAARSCPPIAFYDAGAIDEQLELASRTFVENDVEVDPEAREVVLSVIFKYYQADFGGEEGVRAFLLGYLEGERRARLERAFREGWPVRHRRYDWTLNQMRDEAAPV